MIYKILSQLKLIEAQLNNMKSLNMPDYLEELNLLNEKLDVLDFCINNL